MSKGLANTFADQDKLAAIMGQGKKKSAIPGGGTGPNSAYQFRTDAGYATGEEAQANGSGTSIFDPVLCELAYRWFSPQGGTVLDPFAGGSVRGIVASRLGRQYVGVDLRPEQVEANRHQASIICPGMEPEYHVGDSAAVIPGLDIEADMIFSCPPYADLEVYSDDPLDLSAMDYPEFLAAYRRIISAACDKLAEDRFAVFVVGDVRDKRGIYRNFVGHTVEAFEAAGLGLYNEAILVTAAGSLPIRAGKQFATTRKLGKTHQQMLVFVKGDPKRATEACGEVEFGEVEGAAGDDSLGDPFEISPEITGPLTPIELHAGILVKRDDLFEVGGVRGGKVRTCWHLSQGAPGLVTAGSRASPQVNIVAHIAAELGIPCRVHIPQGELSPEVEAARQRGAEIVQHKAGYNNVIIARAREDAAARGWAEIPFGMECRAAIAMTSAQVGEIPEGVKRIVVPVGSGMSLAGILHGMARAGLDIPVLGVVVGADPYKRLAEYAPVHWQDMVKLVPAGMDYHKPAPANMLGELKLDPIYEAKCLPFLQEGDMLWVVGIRQTA